MRLSEQTVTPARARELLARSEGVPQRPLNETRVRSMMDAIARGEWKLNHQAIAIGPDGLLRDGMHRTTAIARGTTTVTLIVAEDVDEDVMDTVDIGARRTPADILHMNGYTNTTIMSGAARFVLMIRRMLDEGLTWEQARQRGQITPTALLDLLQEEPLGEVLMGQLTVANRLANVWGRFGVRTWMAAAQTHLVEHGASEGQRLEFVERLQDGAFQQPGSPVFALQKYVMSPEGLVKVVPVDRGITGIACTIKAFNHYVTRDDASSIMWRKKDPWPTVVTPA